ncbi:MAG: type II toxin-antitoxin system prevent-host-death family antitoxin [Myxococcota bacterium]
MKQLRVSDLKAHLSEHLRAVRAGESIAVFDRQTPIARVVPFESDAGALVVRKARRPLRQVLRSLKRPRASTATDSLALLLEDRARR